ncbi:MAG: DUF389 domain-containing protein [Candidatus Thiodiazotropha sp.]
MTDATNKPRVAQRIYDYFPTLERQARLELVERISIGADGGVDFIVMMILAATLASLGLLQGSTAVVIGAMLVAPLMGPLVAAGLALTQGNLQLFRKAFLVCGVGILIGLGASLIFGILNPGFEASQEIEARGRPDVFDLGIALVSGMVAAYAMGRPNVSGTLAGVAIAAALLPPLAVVGIGATNNELLIAGNAAILFVTNLVAIVLGAALIFRLLGMHVTVSETGGPAWVRRVTMSLSLIVVMLAAPLILNALEKKHEGQIRPTIYPVSADVRNAVSQYINKHPELNVIVLGRNSVEPDTGITLIAASTGPLVARVKDELRQIVRTARKDDQAIVRVFILLQAPVMDE